MTQAAQAQFITCACGASIGAGSASCPQCGKPALFDTKTALDRVEMLYTLALYSGGILGMIFMIICFISGWRGAALSIPVLWIGAVVTLRASRNKLRKLESS